VTAVAQDAEILRELDAGTRRAWEIYRQRTRGLEGEEYERAEREAWADLQSELRRLQRRRQSLIGTSV
jgi:hypothetical protein